MRYLIAPLDDKHFREGNGLSGGGVLLLLFKGEEVVLGDNAPSSA